MADSMSFPDTFDEFAEQFKIIDKEEVYTNGSELIPIFRVKQWLEHTADAEEVKHGKWESFEIPHMMRCSECGVSELDIHRTKFDYCPNCGAKMDE